MKKDLRKSILVQTERGYDAIAQKFSQTRKHFWRELEFIREYARKGDKVLDFGCGNGRLLELTGESGAEYFGVDVSRRLIKIAQEKYPQKSAHFQKINPLAKELPFAKDFFDIVYSIAVFHHFPGKKYRTRMAKELFAKTKEGGTVIVTVWYLWQRNYIKNIWQNWKDKIRGKSELDWNDCVVPFTDNQGKKVERFHHAFTKNELRKLFASVGFRVEQCRVVGGRNIVLIGHK